MPLLPAPRRRPHALVTAVAVGALMTGVLSSACGKTLKEDSSVAVDSVSLPAEPLVKALPSVGKYGGRFVYGETISPKTFNGVMANETSSTDITDLLFDGLADFDKITQMDVPRIATKWEIAPDNLTW